LEKEAERRKGDEREREVLDEEEARERAVKEFEMVQMGLSAKGAGSGRIVARQDGKITVEEEVESTPGASKNGTKRKFELDEEELLRIAQEERRKMRKEIDAEKVSLSLLKSLHQRAYTNPTHNRKHPESTSPASGSPPKLPPPLPTPVPPPTSTAVVTPLNQPPAN
jgi:nitric oxide synthase-interacting protein